MDRTSQPLAPLFTASARISQFRVAAQFRSFDDAFRSAPLGYFSHVVEATWQPPDGPPHEVALKLMIGQTPDGRGDGKITRVEFEGEVAVLQRIRSAYDATRGSGAARGDDATIVGLSHLTFAFCAGSEESAASVLPMSAPRGAPLYFIAMEYLRGMTLLKRLALSCGPLLRLEAVLAAAHLTAALAALHKLGFAHADLKGDNILEDGAGQLKLIDYNCSRAASGAALSQGTARGARPWRAPELSRYSASAAEHTNTRESDMWSAGLVIYEMLTGELAYCTTRRPGGHGAVHNWYDLVDAGLSPTVVDPLPADASPVLVEVMDGCLQLDPRKRLSAPDAYAMIMRASEGGIEVAAMVARLRGELSDAGVVEARFRELFDVTALPAGQQAAIDAGAAAAIITALRMHTGVSVIAEQGCSLLLNICATRVGQQAAVDLEIPAAIVAVLKENSETASVAVQGCRVLRKIATLDAGKLASIQAEAPAAIVAALRAHVDIPAVAEHGCAALLNIAVTPDGKQAEVDAGAPAAIVAAILANADSASVAEEGCWALCRIAFIPAGEVAVVNAGATAAVVAALRLHVDTADVAHWACAALSNITSHPAGQQAAVDAGAPAAVIAALHAHADNAIVAEQVCWALRHIARLPAGQQAAVDVGGPAAIVEALRTHVDAAAFLKQGLAALSNISDLPAGFCAAINAGAVATVIAALLARVDIAAVAEMGCAALCFLTNHQSGQEAAVDAGAPAAIISALQIHVGVPVVEERGCFALKNIARLPRGMAAVIDAGGAAYIGLLVMD